MTIRPNHRLLLPLLVLGMTLAASATVVTHATAATSASVQFNFGSSPRWQPIHGTRVREIRGDSRPDYDAFRYGNGYYVFRDDHWYMSRRQHGYYRMLDERMVPRELYRVPRDHWRRYPGSWEERNGRGHGNERGDHGDRGDRGDRGDHGDNGNNDRGHK